MAATNYVVGYGTKLYYLASTDEAGDHYTLIANTIDLKSPEPEVGDIKVTNNQSPDNTHEYGPGMVEPGTLDIDCIYNDAQAATLYGFFGDGIIHKWLEKYVDGSGWQFNGYLKKFGIETKTEDDANKNMIGLKLTNKAAFHTGAEDDGFTTSAEDVSTINFSDDEEEG